MLFSIYYNSLASLARRFKSRVVKRDLHELQLIFTRVLQSGLSPPVSADAASRPGSPAEPITTLAPNDPRAADFRNHFRLWFGGAPWSQVTRGAVIDWLAWSVFDKQKEDMDKMQHMIAKEALVMLEKRSGGRLKDARDDGKPDIVPTKITLDPVNVWSRPGIVYIFADTVNRLARWYLQWKWDMSVSEHEGVE